MPRVLNVKEGRPQGAVYCGRGGKVVFTNSSGREWLLGNPYVIGPDGDRAMVIAKHRCDVYLDPEFMEWLRQNLRGKDLLCFCAPLPCHCDTYLDIANR